MRVKVFIFLLIPCGGLGQWEKWEPWITELGITPYIGIEQGFAAPESLLKYVGVNKGGTELKVAMQVCLPPFYSQWGFSNIYNVILMPSRLAEDTILSPLYLNWRVGVQISYKEAFTYHVAGSLIKAVGAGELGFTSWMLENAFIKRWAFRAGEIQILGNVGGGMTSEVVPVYEEEIRESEAIMNFSSGVFWWTPYISPYLYGGATYPVGGEEKGLKYFFALGVQFVLPRAYLKGLPDISYPKIYSFIREEELSR